MSKQNGHTAPPEAQAGLAEALRVLDEEVMPAPKGDEQGGARARQLTDLQLARRWIEEHPDCRYGLGAMRQYRDGYWPAMPAEVFKQSVLHTLEDAEERGEVRVSRNRLASVKEIIETRAVVEDTRWNARADVFVLRNGTFDLSRREFRAHSPDDYVTNALDFDYDANAVATTFLRVLEGIGKDEADFLQEFCGYALTPDTRHEISVWLYGPPGSGKSTIVEALQATFGTRCGTLGLAEIEQSRFALHDLPDKTLLVATEQPKLYMRATHTLNAIISGEPIRVERKYQDAFTARTNAKILWAMNDLPKLDPGNGLFRRVKVVQARPVVKPDPEVKEQVRRERAGVFNWAVEGLKRLMDRGHFVIPASVQESVEEFQLRNDVPALFLRECCEVGEGRRTKASILYNAYVNWCKANGHEPMAANTAADHWRRLGLRRKERADGTYYEGAQLRAGAP